MMSSKCLIEKGGNRLMLGKVNYKFAVVGYSCNRSDGRIESVEFHQRMCGNPNGHGIDRRQLIEMEKSDTIEMIEISDDAEMVQRNDTQKCVALNSSTCVKTLFDEPNAKSRSYLNDHLNGNISYSYRTHFYLNR